MVRKIAMLEWKERNREGKEVAMDTTEFIKNLFASIPLDKMPRGVDAFELVRDMSKSLDASKGKDFVILEEDSWKYLEKEAFPYIPGKWAFVPGLSDAVHSLIKAEKEVIVE